MKNRRAILMLFLANTVSGISQGICMIAIPWYFITVLDWQSSFGIFYGSLTIISTFWSIYAGTLVDKYDRKTIQIIYSLTGSLLMATAAISGNLLPSSLWIVSGVVFGFTVLLYNVHYINIYSFAQEITPTKYYSKVISYIEVQGQATTILGGALAAILMDGTSNGRLTIFGFQFTSNIHFNKWDLYEIFGLDAITYLLAVIILSSIKYESLTTRTADKESAWQRVKIGWDFLKEKPSLLIVGWASSAVFVSILLVSFFLMPSYVSLVLNATSSVFASSELYFALGAVLAGLFARFFLINRHEVTRILVLFVLALIVYITFIYNTQLGIFYLANILLGFSNAAIRYNRVSYFWKLIPNSIMGRVSSVINMSSYILRAILGFVFSMTFFTGKAGIIYVMIFLFFFIAIAGFIIYLFSDKIKKLEF